jgi:hypothetical protein
VEYVILVMALPWFALSLWQVLRPHHPTRGALSLEGTAGLRPARVLPRSQVTRRAVSWLFVVGVFGGAFLLLPVVHVGDNLVRLITLCRYGLLAGLFLVGLVPLALQAAPGLLANLFVLRSARHLFHVAWMSFLVATMVVVVCRIDELNAKDRYGVDELPVPAAWREWVRVATILVLCVPVIVACARCSKEAFLPATAWRWAPWVIAGMFGLAGGAVLIGLVGVGQFVFLSRHVQAPDLLPLQSLAEWVWTKVGMPRSKVLYGLGDSLAGLLESNGSPGYTTPGPDGQPRLAPGHAQGIAGLAVVLGVYLLYYLAVKAFGVRALRATEMPPLFLLLLLILLLGFFFQGAAFALDRYWIPSSLAVLLFAVAIYQFSRTDHLFSLGRTAASGGVKAASRAAPDAPELNLVAETWDGPPVAGQADGQDGPRRTLVAVTASGGGIQAAAWTARALVGLHELYGDAFTNSIRLISAVSGGSVGAMYCLDAWPPGGAAWQAPGDSQLPLPESVCDRAMASSLEATAWGLVFPDLLRILAPVLVSPTDDRGTRIEEAWRNRMARPEARITDWVAPIREGRMPVPVFNATVVETGQRFLASPVVGRPKTHLPPAAEPRELGRLYRGSAPLVSTMARLSATFPFVSPICRPQWKRTDLWAKTEAYHFADGGYVDNEGMVTVIEWLWDLLDPSYLPRRRFDRILLIRLMPFPSSGVAQARLDRGWFYATLGPIDAIQNVRTASQQERNELAVRLFSEAAAQRGVPVRSAVLRFDMPEAAEPPLSWMLTSPQKAAVDRAWRWLEDAHNSQSPLGEIDAWFPRQPPPKTSGLASAGPR